MGKRTLGIVRRTLIKLKKAPLRYFVFVLIFSRPQCNLFNHASDLISPPLNYSFRSSNISYFLNPGSKLCIINSSQNYMIANKSIKNK